MRPLCIRFMYVRCAASLLKEGIRLLHIGMITFLSKVFHLSWFPTMSCNLMMNAQKWHVLQWFWLCSVHFTPTGSYPGLSCSSSRGHSGKPPWRDKCAWCRTKLLCWTGGFKSFENYNKRKNSLSPCQSQYPSKTHILGTTFQLWSILTIERMNSTMMANTNGGLHSGPMQESGSFQFSIGISHP